MSVRVGFFLSGLSILASACSERGNGGLPHAAGSPPRAEAWGETADAWLPDFSHAGYHFGEREIPHVDGPVFDVTDFGAVPGDGRDDTAAVQAAIDQAAAAGGGVVFFPPGVFHFFTGLEENRPLLIESGGIVLRGSGANEGGTILHKVNGSRNAWMVNFQFPQGGFPFGNSVARVVRDLPLNGRDVRVDDASGLQAGDWIALWAENRMAVAEQFMGSRSIEEGWTRIRENGVPLREIHRIEAIEGNRIRLRAPVKIAMPVSFDIRIRPFEPMAEAGVEDLAFMGNWMGQFLHHRSVLDDYEFNAVRFLGAVNGWVRRCLFINLNQTLNFDTTANMTVLHTRIAGSAAHSGPIQNRSTNNLIALSSDLSDGAWHNLQWRAQTAGAVFWRVEMHPVMPIDIHGMYAYGSLLDAIQGGYLMDSGGPVASFPQHGPGLVIWNFDYLSGASAAQRGNRHRSAPIRFWGGRPWVVDPIVIGLHGIDGIELDEETISVLRSPGEAVEPESLYEEQIKARLGGLPPWVDAAKEFWEDYRREPLPGFFHPSTMGNEVFHHFPRSVPMGFLGEQIQSLQQMRRHPNDFEVTVAAEGVFHTDLMKVRTLMLNVLSYVHSFSVPFGRSALYAEPAGPGSVLLEVEEGGGDRRLSIKVDYPVAEPDGYYDQFPLEMHVFGKYPGDNKALEWDGAVELARSLGADMKKENHEGGSRVWIRIPEMPGRPE